MKNKTGLVALVVLAAATLLMVFFVLPNMNRQKPAETPAATGTEAAAEGGETKTADGKQARSTQAGGEAATQPEAGSAADATPQAAEAEQDAARTEAAQTETAQAEDGAAAADEPATREAAGQETAAADAAAGDATAGAASADPAAGWVTPAFDLLRVEPDGSTVIAGRAQPNTRVEIRDGETVIATADVGPSGDFAAVFDQPLKAGDYQLTLNASDGKGASKASEEVATVSVPTDAGGEVLAMVSEPGAASRLITVPDDAGASAAAEEKPADEPVAETAAASSEAGTAAGESAAAAATAEEGGAATTAGDTPATQGAATADAASGVAGKAAQVRVAAVELEGDRMFVAGNARPGALVRIYAGDRLVGEAKADEGGRFVVDGRIDLAVGRHTIRADVMAADGSRVELRASVPFDRPEGEQVAVVAQDDPASAQATPALGLVGGGTFDRLRSEAAKALGLLKGLFAEGRLPTAEELAAARSATEIALKSLAEFKPGAEEGEVARDMSARASAAAADALARLQALPNDAVGVGAALGSIETAVAAALAPAIETAEGAAVANDTQAAPAEAAAETQTASDDAAPATDGVVAATPSQTADGGAAADTQAAASGSAGDTAAGTEEGAAAADAGAAAAGTGGAAAAVEGGQAAAGTEGVAAAAEGGQAAAGEPETVEQAPLQQSKTSVIIRRGDTLWQISRRIYGKGVRYTTIYLANQDQIHDPDRIIPGQVFGVPDQATESDADAEALHRRHLRGE
ncbi:LysM peptidoglycan-binding domain-containing protein [Shinella pollutisoli]|uniref:LysM peptidoglycan-binding domain-containing protein n=1 Tax=Shinella pollutisoli TaxID=2250594 RepID=A0ABV7DEM4_9HYPH|nr:LysM peptidoglycan-binding domain-containing protein [Shinella pollutisoli]